MKALFFALTIVLTPEGGYLGKIPDIQVCEFRYGPGTILKPTTRLNVDPYREHYGNGSIVPAGSGSTCSPCYVVEILHLEDETTEIYCEVKPKYNQTRK